MFSAIKPFLDLCRVSNLATVGTNTLAAVVLSGVEFGWASFWVLFFSMALFYSGGMCLNDMIDAPADRVKKPFRPIPSGRISLRSAAVFTALLFAAGMALLLLVPYPKAAWGGLLLLVLIVTYDRYHKKHPLTVFLMAACRGMIFVISSVAVAGAVGLSVALIGSLQFFYVLVISLVARYENNRKEPFPFPVIPMMIAGISMLDGIAMAVLASPAWLVAGIAGSLITHLGQRYVRGD
jgi:4-hydroxybenzoate polyprenyltransferase